LEYQTVLHGFLYGGRLDRLTNIKLKAFPRVHIVSRQSTECTAPKIYYPFTSKKTPALKIVMASFD